MNKTDGQLITQQEGFTVAESLMTYSEEEKQENEINAVNAKLIFTWKFLVIPREVFMSGLSGNTAIVYSFIHSFIGNGNRFYFTNDQLAEMFNISESAASNIVTQLGKQKLVELSFKRKASGGQMRYITIPTVKNCAYQLSKIDSSNDQKLTGNNINIIKDNIYTSPDELVSFLETFNRLFNSAYRITTERSKKLKLRRKTYTLQEILKATENCSASKFNQGKNDRGWKADPDYLLRSDEQIDKFLNKDKVIDEGEYKTVEQLREEGTLW